MKRFSRKMWVLFGVLAVAAITAIGAYAYFTVSGSGTGSASVATPQAVTIYNSPNPIVNLWPGVAQAVDVYVSNPNPGNVYIGTVTGTFQTATPLPNTNCAIPNVTVSYNGEVAPGDTKVGTVSVLLPDRNAAQNACGPYTITWSE